MDALPPVLLVGLLVLAGGSALLLWRSGSAFRRAQHSRRSRRWLPRLRRLTELQTERLPESRLVRPLRGDAAWRLLVRRGRRRRQTAVRPRG
jgi:hypothetical protein